jgi:hypothetical protein
MVAMVGSLIVHYGVIQFSKIHLTLPGYFLFDKIYRFVCTEILIILNTWEEFLIVNFIQVQTYLEVDK